MLEVLLTISAITIIAGVAIPVYQQVQVRNDLDIAATTFTQSAHRAQVLAQAIDGDTTWGVYVQLGSITLFQGASYGARDTAFDETFDVPTSITPSGISEVVFAKFSGLPTATGTATLTSNTNETRNITVNAKGMVSY